MIHQRSLLGGECRFIRGSYSSCFSRSCASLSFTKNNLIVSFNFYGYSKQFSDERFQSAFVLFTDDRFY